MFFFLHQTGEGAGHHQMLRGSMIINVFNQQL